jgi:hypothetical protein
MQQKLLQISCAAFLILNLGCSTGPKVTVCVSDTKSGGFECYDERTGQKYFMDYKDSEKYIALSPTDAQTLFQYCSQKK